MKDIDKEQLKKEKRNYPLFKDINTELAIAYIPVIQEILDQMKDTSIAIMQEFQDTIAHINAMSKQVDKTFISIDKDIKNIATFFNQLSNQYQEDKEFFETKNKELKNVLNQLTTIITTANTEIKQVNNQLQSFNESMQTMQDLFLQQQKVMKQQKKTIEELHTKMISDLQKTVYIFIASNISIVTIFIFLIYHFIKK